MVLVVVEVVHGDGDDGGDGGGGCGGGSGGHGLEMEATFVWRDLLKILRNRKRETNNVIRVV